jgi:hypothetical protein
MSLIRHQIIPRTANGGLAAIARPNIQPDRLRTARHHKANAIPKPLAVEKQPAATPIR